MMPNRAEVVGDEKEDGWTALINGCEIEEEDQR